MEWFPFGSFGDCWYLGRDIGKIDLVLSDSLGSFLTESPRRILVLGEGHDEGRFDT